MYEKPKFNHYFPPVVTTHAEPDVEATVVTKNSVQSSLSSFQASPSFSCAASQPASTITPITGARTEVPKRDQRKATRHTKSNAEDNQSTGVDNDLINTGLQERFNRYHARDQGRSNAGDTTEKVGNFISQYLQQSSMPAATNSWLSCPEFPTEAELRDVAEPWQITDPQDGGVLLRGNNLEGAWQSREEYLGAHFEMIREEQVRPLREAISWCKSNPHSSEDQRAFGGNMGIYEKASLHTLLPKTFIDFA